MTAEKRKTIEKVKGYIPSAHSWRRALVSCIPYVGGGLDHLLFDKAGEIRLQKLEVAVNSMSKYIESLNDERIILQWFDSIEALEMFKRLFEKVEFEHSDSKIKALSQVYILFGTTEHVADPNKYAVLDIISKMTDNQREVFKVLNVVPLENKQYSAGDIDYIRKARWQSSLLDYINNNPSIREKLNNDVSISVELDILASFNLLSILDTPTSNNAAYRITEIGRLIYSYLTETS